VKESQLTAPGIKCREGIKYVSALSRGICHQKGRRTWRYEASAHPRRKLYPRKYRSEGGISARHLAAASIVAAASNIGSPLHRPA